MIEKIVSLIAQFHIHPILVHFPIALFISALGLEILAIVLKKESLQDASWINFKLAVLITPLVVLTGWLEARHLHLSHKIADIHKIFAFWTWGISLASGIGLWLIKKKSANKKLFRICFFVSLTIIVALVSICGYYGGRLVYEYGIGVAE